MPKFIYKDMIIIKLKGGLGNQMFQYACGRHLAQKHGDVLRLDLEWYQPGGVAAGDTARSYALDSFLISSHAASKEDILRVRGRQSRIGTVIKKIVRKLIPVKSYVFDPAVLEQKGDVYLDGYFQSERYFKDSEPIIRNEFRLRNAFGEAAYAIAQDIDRSDAVALHVRRGDYVSNKNAQAFHGSCSPDYYREAISLIAKRVDAPTFFVFSDDVDWVKGHIEIPNAVYVSRKEIADTEELILMSKCKHAIIANSSFGWWGAWLNENPNKTVIAPKQWVADPQVNTVDAVPAEWIRL